MKPLLYTGMCAQEDDKFVVKLELTFPTKPEARECGEMLHKFIESKMDQSGDRLKPIVPKMPYLVPGNLVFLPDKVGT